jgi:hypothetical protein
MPDCRAIRQLPKLHIPGPATGCQQLTRLAECDHGTAAVRIFMDNHRWLMRVTGARREQQQNETKK